MGDGSAGLRVAGFGAALVLVFGTAWALGGAAGPGFAEVMPHRHAAAVAPGADGHAGHGSHDSGSDGHDHGGGAPTSDGLAATAAGYTFVPRTTSVPAGAATEYAFTITGSDGRPVTSFQVEHEKPLHLIVVRRDGAGFQHLHPEMGADGVWRTPLTLPAAGVWRVFADIVPTGGPALTLGADLFAPGRFDPVTVAPTRTAEVDGYQIRLDGALTPGAPSQVFVTVSRAGAPVTDLQPYLGAFGHMVALRGADLAYLHVHPGGTPPAPTDRAGPGIAFTVDVPTAGDYRVYVDFRHDDVVRTAAFAVTAG